MCFQSLLFHTYIFGNPFTFMTENKAIMSLFDPFRNVLPQAFCRIQRWFLKLALYQYTLKFCPTAQHANADTLGRFPLLETPENVPVPGEFVLLIDHLAEAPNTAAQLKSFTAKDPLLAKVLQFIRYVLPNSVNDPDMKPYMGID